MKKLKQAKSQNYIPFDCRKNVQMIILMYIQSRQEPAFDRFDASCPIQDYSLAHFRLSDHVKDYYIRVVNPPRAMDN